MSSNTGKADLTEEQARDRLRAEDYNDLPSVGVLLAVALTWPPAMTLFRFGPFEFDDLAVSLAAAAAVLLAMEAIKPLWRVSFRS